MKLVVVCRRHWDRGRSYPSSFTTCLKTGPKKSKAAGIKLTPAAVSLDADELATCP